jgi:hypothetical protein
LRLLIIALQEILGQVRRSSSIGLTVLGSLLIFIGGIVRIGDEWSSWDFYLWALSGSIDKVDEYESAFAGQEDRNK